MFFYQVGISSMKSMKKQHIIQLQDAVIIPTIIFVIIWKFTTEHSFGWIQNLILMKILIIITLLKLIIGGEHTKHILIQNTQTIMLLV